MSALIVPSSVPTDTITRQSCFPEAKGTGHGFSSTSCDDMGGSGSRRRNEAKRSGD